MQVKIPSDKVISFNSSFPAFSTWLVKCCVNILVLRVCWFKRYFFTNTFTCQMKIPQYWLLWGIESNTCGLNSLGKILLCLNLLVNIALWLLCLYAILLIRVAVMLGWHSAVMVRTVPSQQEGPGFGSCVDFECSPHISPCVGLHRVFLLPLTVGWMDG